ncbi:hypothetical protein, partial [Chitinophaga sp.]|uniref:hypothetical protein n=1 Tax=Chitinophaga sp. TaxID=1869181 RepID=UPI0031D8C288
MINTLPFTNASMVNTLHQIADRIIVAKDFTEDMSLVNGQAGMCLFLFHYAQTMEREEYYEKAQTFLIENYRFLVRQVKHPNSTVVPGIGWLISHLGHRKLIGIDTDEILNHVDKVIFEKLQYGFSPLFDQGGLLDMTGYLLQRYGETGFEVTKVMIAEKLLAVIDEIRIKMDDGLFKGFDRHYAPLPAKGGLNKMGYLSALLHFSSRVLGVGIYPVIIREMQAEIIALLKEYVAIGQAANYFTTDIVHGFTTLLRVRDALGRAGVEMEEVQATLEELGKMLPGMANSMRKRDLVLGYKLLEPGAKEGPAIRQLLQAGVLRDLERESGMPDLGLCGGLA